MSIAPTAPSILVLAFVILVSAPSAVAGPANWRRAYVIDSGLATLRASPGPQARLLKRLRHGRMVAIVERSRVADGATWVRVAVTRRTRGWLPVSAIAWPGNPEGERRLSSRIESETGFERLELARLAIDRFPRLREIATRAFSDEAGRAAAALTERAAVRFADEAPLSLEERRLRMLLDPLLDRYVRLGVRFEADPVSLRYRVLN